MHIKQAITILILFFATYIKAQPGQLMSVDSSTFLLSYGYSNISFDTAVTARKEWVSFFAKDTRLFDFFREQFKSDSLSVFIRGIENHSGVDSWYKMSVFVKKKNIPKTELEGFYNFYYCSVILKRLSDIAATKPEYQLLFDGFQL